MCAAIAADDDVSAAFSAAMAFATTCCACTPTCIAADAAFRAAAALAAAACMFCGGGIDGGRGGVALSVFVDIAPQTRGWNRARDTDARPANATGLEPKWLRESSVVRMWKAKCNLAETDTGTDTDADTDTDNDTDTNTHTDTNKVGSQITSNDYQKCGAFARGAIIHALLACIHGYPWA